MDQVPEGAYKEHPNPPCRYSLLTLLSICPLKHSPRILLLYFLHLNNSCSNTMAGDALMLGITGLMMLPMLGELFPQGQDDATVRITVGTYNPYQFDGSNLVGGPVPNVALFDVNGERIGFRRGAGHGEMKSGEGTDVTIAPYADNDKADPEYVSISASSSDAVCIVAVTVVGADTNGAGGAQQWGWNGDFGKMCGQVWYPSRKSITDADAEQIRPACIWISNDGRFPMGFTLHMPDFAGNTASGRINEYKQDNRFLCDSKPRQHFYSNLTEEQFSELHCAPIFKDLPVVDPTSGMEDPSKVLVDGDTRCTPKIGDKVTQDDIIHLRKFAGAGRNGMMPTYGIKRSRITGRKEDGDVDDKAVKEKRQTMWPWPCELNHAVIVPNGQSAKELCSHPNSAGPDFGNREEGFLCDMCARKLWPFCSNTVTTGCFDEQARAIRSSNPPTKRYENLHLWDD
jgi:hypothetical protein